MIAEFLAPDLDFLKTLTILYVEDDPDIHARLDFFLQRHVGKLIIAYDGEEGIRSYGQNRPDIIITD
ncbi:MAG: hypothetical protein HQM02_11520, partial [Magnetococcales bacterium]|nr:hypothetical protein [Magnetococcales bacterium]